MMALNYELFLLTNFFAMLLAGINLIQIMILWYVDNLCGHFVLDSYAKMPPLETFMGIDPHTARKHLYHVIL